MPLPIGLGHRRRVPQPSALSPLRSAYVARPPCSTAPRARVCAAVAASAPRSMSNLTFRWNIVKSASRRPAFASERMTSDATPTGTPRATRSVATVSGRVTRARPACCDAARSCARLRMGNPACNAFAPALISSVLAPAPSADFAVRSSANRPFTATTIRSPSAPRCEPSSALSMSGSVGSRALRAESTRTLTAIRVVESSRKRRASPLRCAAAAGARNRTTQHAPTDNLPARVGQLTGPNPPLRRRARSWASRNRRRASSEHLGPRPTGCRRRRTNSDDGLRVRQPSPTTHRRRGAAR